jgi:subtilisin family serine protease
VAPSNGGTRGIFTTDVSIPGRGFNPGTAGDAKGLYCDDFGGTSSATPLVAGLCGLLLSLKPQLAPDDVRKLLIGTAKKIGPASAYKANGHSNRYGFGRIDAGKAVAAAKAWKPKKPG